MGRSIHVILSQFAALSAAIPKIPPFHFPN